MAGRNARTVDQVRRDIEAEREQLAGAAESLRESIGEATNIGAKVRANLPIVAAGALGHFHRFDDVKRLLDPIAPNGVIKFITSLQKDSKGGTSAAAFLIGFFGAVWAASGAMSSVIKAVNRAVERQETRPFWKVRAVAILLVVVSGITTAGIFLLIVVGGSLGDAISKKAHLGGAFQWTWGIVRWPVAFAAILLFFGLVYCLAPNREQRSWKWITPGSLLGGLLWLLLSGLFALYVTYAGNYTKTYGTIASGVILLLWLNYSAFALLFGAELNAELERQAEIRAAGGERAGLVKPVRRA